MMRDQTMSQMSDADRAEYQGSLAAAGNDARACFQMLAGRCLQRNLRANAGAEMVPEALARCCGTVWDMVEDHGWPTPVKTGEEREAVETELPNLAAWVERAMESMAAGPLETKLQATLRNAVGQLFKACCYPEITVCRNSYRLQTADGRCKRQIHANAKSRLSGSPCVDCPWTVRLTAEQHARLLRDSWAPANAVAFDFDPMCFLPEDFRSLRRFLWQHARSRQDTL